MTLLSIHDITERKLAEGARARLAAIVESSDDAIVSKDLHGVITSWNKGAERLFGYVAQEAIGQSVTMLIPPDHADEEPAILARIRRGESIEPYETVRHRKDGTLLNVSLCVSPIVDSQGNVVGASKIARDITERKRAEALLNSQKQALQLLAEDASLQVVLEFLIGVVERESGDGMIAAITLLNEAGTHFQRRIGPSFPEAFNAAVEGVEVSSPAMLCARVVTRREPMAVNDFDERAECQTFAQFVAPYGMRSGWSTPIFSSSGRILGTFANYFRYACDPTPKNQELVEMVIVRPPSLLSASGRRN